MNISRAVLVLMLAVLAGCASNHGGYATESLTDAEFVALTEEEQEEYQKAVTAEFEKAERNRQILYQAGRKVYSGTSDAGFTYIWNPQLQFVDIYSGYITKPMGLELAAQSRLATDAEGNILYNEVKGMKQPVIFANSFYSQETLGRALLRGGFQIASTTSNGVLAAEIGKCKNCGSISLNNGAQALSGSESNAASNTSVNLGCPSGSCSLPEN